MLVHLIECLYDIGEHSESVVLMYLSEGLWSDVLDDVLVGLAVGDCFLFDDAFC